MINETEELKKQLDKKEKLLEEVFHVLRQVKFGLKFQGSTKSALYKSVELLIEKRTRNK